jgi:predicted flap endonuclease-1-like 5' DNA nuclease
MLWLVFETFILMIVFVAIGIVLGSGLKHAFDSRLAAAAAASQETVWAEPAIIPDVEPVAPIEPETATLADADAITDPVKAAAADQIGVRPTALAGARDGQPDDLKRIKGIGPQNEARLNALGIYHYDQIAGWTTDEARWVSSYLAFPGRIERENWIEQARGLTVPA